MTKPQTDGHLAAKCWARKGKADFNAKDTKVKDTKQKKGECHHCHKVGHWKGECRKLLREKAEKKDKKEPNKGDAKKKHIRKVEGGEEEDDSSDECEQFGDSATLNSLRGPVEKYRENPFRTGAATTGRAGSRPSKEKNTWYNVRRQ